MSALIDCPDCGARGMYEFRFGGEVRERPSPEAGDDEWLAFTYLRKNMAGVQREWWYHRDGCRNWIVVERDTRNNRVTATERPE